MEPLYHSLTKQQLDAINDTPATYLFVGRAGSGRNLAAGLIAQRLNCALGGNDDCQTCHQIALGSFPDIIRLSQSGKALGIEQVKQLQQTLANRPMSTSAQRVVIIEGDGGLTEPAQNRLLKTLEEPPDQTIIILITAATHQLLPTVVSRSRVIHFRPLGKSDIQQLLESQVEASVAQAVMALSPDTPGQALALASDPELRDRATSIKQVSSHFLAASLFERLTMIAGQGLSDQASELVATLADQTANHHQLLVKLPAIADAQARLDANVGGRTVLEALALRL